MRAAAVSAICRRAAVGVVVVAALILVRQASAEPPLSIDALSATREKPLFSPTRQKPSAVSSVVVAAAEQDEKPAIESDPQYELAGIIAGSDTVTVLLRDPKKNELLKVRSGDRIGKWEVVATSNYSVRLQSGQRNLDIQIFSE